MNKAAYVRRAGLNQLGSYWTSDYSQEQLRQFCRSAAFTKQAAVGGSNETGFESSFSSLAYAYLKDKAPRLLDYLVGFQLVDRNDDNTKALGIFGFRMAGQWLYCPMFFLNGDLKGHDLLYLKNQDIFVPLKENWVNYLLSKKTHLLGEASHDMDQYSGKMPDIQSYRRHLRKRGFDAWTEPVLPLLAATTQKRAKALYTEVGDELLEFSKVAEKPFDAALASMPSLDRFLGKNFAMLKSAFALSRKHPLLKQAFDMFYGKDCFSRWGESCKQHVALASKRLNFTGEQVKQANDSRLLFPLEKEAHPATTGKLQLFRLGGDYTITCNGRFNEKAAAALVPEERELLFSQGYLVKDAREETQITVAYDEQEPFVYSNPTETGVYELLESGPAVTKALILIRPNVGEKDRLTKPAVALKLQDDKIVGWTNYRSDCLWTKQEAMKPDFKSWFTSQTGTTSPELGGIYVAVSPAGQSAGPFCVTEDLGDKQYTVRFMSNTPYLEDKRYNKDYRFNSQATVSYSCSSKRMHLLPEENKGADLTLDQDLVRIPPDFKLLYLETAEKDTQFGGYKNIYRCGSEGDKKILPGSMDEVQKMLFEKTSQLKIAANDHEVILKSAICEPTRLTKTAAFLTLVSDHGLTCSTAKAMLKKAESQKHGVYRMAYAPGFGTEKNAFIGQRGSTGAYFPEADEGTESLGPYNSIRSNYPQEDSQTIDRYSASNNYDVDADDPWKNRSGDDFKRVMQATQQAVSKGQKSIFDTTMFNGLIKTVRQEDIIEENLSDLMKALDRLGRLRVMFYWHQEEFEDRYGKQDLPELEDTLRNTFDSLGDLTLFLKKKTVETDLSNDIDIEEAARN